MTDRIFALVGLAIVIAYGVIAFTAIRAPFQYDPLGPESWPQILSIAAALCLLYILVRPDRLEGLGDLRTLRQIGVMVVVLVLYAASFERLGFVLSTALFCGIVAFWTGARPLPAAVYGIAFGLLGYVLFVRVLALNLPAGILGF